MVGRQPLQEVASPERQQGPEHGSRHREQQVLGQQLTQQPGPARAERETNRDFLLSRRHPGEHEIRDVHTPDQEDDHRDPGRGREDRQGVAPGPFGTAAAVHDPESRDRRAFGGGRGRAGGPALTQTLVEQPLQVRTRLCVSDARLEPRHDLHPPERDRPRGAGIELRRQCHWQRDVRRVAYPNPIEACRRDADDDDRNAIHRNRFSDDRGIRLKSPLPVAIADDPNGLGTLTVVIARQGAAPRSAHAQRLEVAPADQVAGHGVRLTIRAHTGVSGSCNREHIGKRAAAIAEPFKGEGGERRPKTGAIRTRPAVTRVARHHRFGQPQPVEHHQRFWIRDRQALDQHRIHHAECGGRRADAKRQGRDRGEREPGVGDERAERVPQVAHHCRPRCPMA